MTLVTFAFPYLRREEVDCKNDISHIPQSSKGGDG
jgi:hypothetical protein